MGCLPVTMALGYGHLNIKSSLSLDLKAFTALASWIPLPILILLEEVNCCWVRVKGSDGNTLGAGT